MYGERKSRNIECPECGLQVEEVWYFKKTGITKQYAWCVCGWGGSYPFLTKKSIYTKICVGEDGDPE